MTHGKPSLMVAIVGAVLLGPPVGQAQDDTPVRVLCRDLASPDSTVRTQALVQLLALGDEAVEALLEGLDNATADGDDGSRLGLHALAEYYARPPAKKSRRATFIASLAEYLRGDAPNRAKEIVIAELGVCGGEEVVRPLAACLQRRGLVDEASRALAANPSPGALQALCRALPNVRRSSRVSIINALADRGDPAAAAVVIPELEATDEALRLAAVRAVGRLGDPQAAPALASMLNQGAEAERRAVFDAYLSLGVAAMVADPGRAATDGAEHYLKIGDALWRAGREAAMRQYARALEVSTTDEDRAKVMTALAVAGRGALPGETEPRRLSSSLEREAWSAYVKVARSRAHAGQEARAIEMLVRVIAMRPPDDVLAELYGALSELGVDIDPGRQAGFITTWWIIGPFSGPEIDRRHPPEDRIDLRGIVRGDAGALSWTEHHTTHPSGIVDLAALITPNQKVTAYLYAEVTVDDEGAALIETRSDDNEMIWLNGEEVYAYPGHRMMGGSGDKVEVHLRQGTNRVLVKVGNYTLGWQVYVRITDLDGEPLELVQKEEL